MSRFTRKITRFTALAVLLLASLLIGVVISELILRMTILENRQYENEAVRFAMNHLRTDKEAGFLWKKNLRVGVEENPGWYDQERFPLITDEHGFFNPLEAINRQQAGTPVDIIGLGDSFMHGAAYEFYEYFKDKGFFYYNMSMSRHSPPQYNIILKKYALPLRPRWILYGIYENDFDETVDFENWQESHSDWFAFHSGTWFGPAVKLPLWRALLEKYTPGISMLEKRVRRQFGWGQPSYQRVQGRSLSRQQKAENVYRYIEEAYAMANDAGISFLCLIIPVRDVDARGRSIHDAKYDYILHKLKQNNIPTLDLRPAFNNQPDRKQLFYKMDGHWNREGMKVASQLILKEMKQ